MFLEAGNQRFEKLKSHDENEKGPWNEVINIGEELMNHQRRLIQTLPKLKEIWDGHLGTIKAKTHQIDLTKYTKPFFSITVQGGTEKR